MSKKTKIFLLPFIVIIVLFIPGIIRMTTSISDMRETSEGLWNLFLSVESIFLMTWALMFLYVPRIVYVLLTIIYTTIVWIYLRRKGEGNKLFFLIWIILCLVSIVLYWKLRWLYYGMIYG